MYNLNLDDYETCEDCNEFIEDCECYSGDTDVCEDCLEDINYCECDLDEIHF